MSPLNKLAFHRFLLPGLHRWHTGTVSPGILEPPENIELKFKVASNAVLFDCTGMEYDFVNDTGVASLDEIIETGLTAHLPFEYCYFEFRPALGVLAYETDGKIRFWLIEYGIADDEYSDSSDEEKGCELAACLLTDELVLKERPDSIGGDDSEIALSEYDQGAHLLVGISTLLNEHLIATEIRPDPAPQLNAKRIKKGRLPLSAETRVLTINTAAVRRATRGTSLLKHESPRLHWRRGHWRIMHRGSEFESKAWVRRCLVGDPARGSIHKDYRVVWRQPMLESSK
jgi:hypothetical protein